MKFTDHQKRGGASLATAMVALIWTAAAHSEVYRCTMNGTVTYSDAPCPTSGTTSRQSPSRTVPPSNSVAIPTAPAPTGFYGSWSGQAQYQATARGQPLEAAHAVVNLVLTISPDGKVTGESSANDCRALGIASPETPQTLKLDVSLTGCLYAGFNRRYTGTFGRPPDKDYATFSLLSYGNRPGESVMYDIKATMRR